MSLTIVSMFYDLGVYEPNRTIVSDSYVAHLKTFLTLPYPLIIYTSPGYWTWFMHKHRPPGLPLLTVKSQTLEELWWYRHHQARIQENHYAKPNWNGSALKDTWRYKILMYSKFACLRDCLLEFPDNEKWAWLDMGITRATRTLDFPALSTIPDQIGLLRITYKTLAETSQWNIFLRTFYGCAACGFFTARRDYLTKFVMAFERLTLEVLQQGFAPLEENIVVLIHQQNPTWFSCRFGDYHSLFCNYVQVTSEEALVRRYYADACQAQDEVAVQSVGQMMLQSWLHGTFSFATATAWHQFLEVYYRACQRTQVSAEVHLCHLLAAAWHQLYPLWLHSAPVRARDVFRTPLIHTTKDP